MLQRIYGTSWASQKDLDDYLKRLEEAEKRDHRKLGKEMNLFHLEKKAQAQFLARKGLDIISKINQLYENETRYCGVQRNQYARSFRQILWRSLDIGKNLEQTCILQQLPMRKYLR